MTDSTHDHDEDDWFSSGADAAHTAWLEEMGHVNDPMPGDGWLVVDQEAPGGVRALTPAEAERYAQLVAATTPQVDEQQPAQDEPEEDEPE